jgi:hypothetical protein
MSKGMVFVWTPKEHVSQLLAIMEQKHFQYVENFEIINFDINKARGYMQGHRRPASEEKLEDKTLDEEVELGQLIKALIHVNPCDLIADCSSPYFNASKRTLLMFKKVSPPLLRTAYKNLSSDTNAPATWCSTCRCSWDRSASPTSRPISTT